MGKREIGRREGGEKRRRRMGQGEEEGEWGKGRGGKMWREKGIKE